MASPVRQNAVVEGALTGDSVRLQGGKTLKYIGCQAYPLESKLSLIREYGQSAEAFNETLVKGKKVEIEWDSRIRDQKNNLLGYVFLEDGRFVNEVLLANGHAKTKIKAPNLRYAARLRAAESEARKAKLGVWAHDPTVISGNRRSYIGEKNTKIYYLPRSPELERIPGAQWVYFDSRVDAKAAGYHACPTCKESSPDEPADE
jgi:micrococcal nuclease